MLVAGGVGLQLWPSARAHVPRRALAVLDAKSFAIVAAIAERVVMAPGADPAEIAHRFDAALTTSPPEAQADVKTAILLVESAAAGLLFDGRPRPFTRLAPLDRDAALYAFRDSRVQPRRAAYQALRKLCLAAHYSQPSTWASVGYPGPPDIELPADYKVD